MVDCEKLINLVFEREPLWDIKSKCYHNRDVCRKLWSDISTEMGVKSETLKAKWQNLRDTFRKEFNKRKRNTGDGTVDEILTSKWKFYENMTFLKDTLEPRKTISNIQKESNEEIPSSPENSLFNDTTVHDEEPENQQYFVESLLSPKLSSTNSNSQTAVKRKKIKNDPITDLIEIEKQKLKRFDSIKENTKKHDDYKDDEDYHFLMSLLPHLKDIPKQRKLSVRLKLQQVIIEEEERRDICENSRSTTTTSIPNSTVLQNQLPFTTNNHENYMNMQYLSSGPHSTSATDLSTLSSWTQQ